MRSRLLQPVRAAHSPTHRHRDRRVRARMWRALAHPSPTLQGMQPGSGVSCRSRSIRSAANRRGPNVTVTRMRWALPRRERGNPLPTLQESACVSLPRAKEISGALGRPLLIFRDQDNGASQLHVAHNVFEQTADGIRRSAGKRVTDEAQDLNRMQSAHRPLHRGWRR